ncbi:MAG: hypothetical protein JRJ49_08930 [Deltaproteobacteria bacterium]|nr:hypothetical protein [Deltaproteobacteria bacterium]
MNKKVFTSGKVCICCAILIMITLSATAYINWNDIKEDFFQIRLSEICHVFINIALAFYIGLHLNLRAKNIAQKKLLFLDLLNELHKKIETIYKFGNNYIKPSSTYKNEQDILEKLKDFSFNLSFVEDTFKENKDYNLITNKIKIN